MRVNYNFLSIVNTLSFVTCLMIHFLSYFIDSDINRVLLSDLTLNVFYPCLLISLILSIVSISNKSKVKYPFIVSNYIILSLICLFFFRIIFVVFFT